MTRYYFRKHDVLNSSDGSVDYLIIIWVRQSWGVLIKVQSRESRDSLFNLIAKGLYGEFRSVFRTIIETRYRWSIILHLPPPNPTDIFVEFADDEILTLDEDEGIDSPIITGE